MSDFFEPRVKNLEPKEDKKIVSSCKKSHKKTKREDSDSSVVKSSEELTEAHHLNKKYCILHSKYTHSMDNCKDLRAMVSKHK